MCLPNSAHRSGSTKIARFARCVADVEQRIVNEFGGSLNKLVVVLVGDLIEGSTSQHSALPNDVPVTEQVRIVRRLIVHMLGKLAPYADAVLVETVPGNHDQQRRDRVTPARDSWAIEACSGAQEVLEVQYDHITWAYPRGSEDVSVAVKVDDVVIGAVHGDQFSSPDRMRQWWAGQALAGAEVGSAQLLLSGHYHHLRVESISKDKTWMQVPALDNGSPWFKNRKGADAPGGLISLRLEKSAPYWSGLEFHTGATA
ncbi:MAG TPA: hypothetical protein VGI66_07915 [Streptosporangiaceae bacterium]